MLDYRNIIKNRELRLKIIKLFRFIPDKLFLQMVFFIKNGKFLNLKTPKTFCEKLNWLKLNGYKPEYSEYVDKLKARDIVKEKLYRDISIPFLGAWEHYKDIDFDSLPDEFVLKCNHDSGSVKIIRDKKTIDHKNLEKFFEGRLKIDNFVLGRDYYRNIKPYIMAEQLMRDENGSDLTDYKFLCFNGKPKLMFMVTDRFGDVKETYFDMDFNVCHLYNSHPNAAENLQKPKLFEEMKALAEKLAENLPFVRIDLYVINNRIYFGEYTFFEAGGFWPYHPDEWERKLGDWIETEPEK